MPNFFRLLFVSVIFVIVWATVASSAIVINEIMYNSPGSPDVEWVELFNSGDVSVELDDWYLLDDNFTHPVCLLSGNLEPGQYLVVVGDFILFSSVHPGVTNTNVNAFDPGGAGFGLGNSNDSVQLFTDDGVLHDIVTYLDGGAWPGSADGDGPSLELVSPFLENNAGSAWDPSLILNGTPGVQNSTFTTNQAPTIHDTDREPRLPDETQFVLINALVSDQEGLASVQLFVDTGAGFVAVPMYDDGNHGDGAAADSLFAASIAPQSDGSLVRYYVQATDAIGQVTTKPSSAPLAFHAYTVGHTPSTLWVSEIVANNVAGMVDEMGEHEDWVEIFNPGGSAVDLTGMFLTDNLGDHRNWMLPPVILESMEFYIVWCDGQPEQGVNHASFSLSAGGEEIGLYDSEQGGNTLIDGFEYGLMGADISFGMGHRPMIFVPGAWDNWGSPLELGNEYFPTPTPGEHNGWEYLSDVVINEILTTSNSGGIDDWVEFYNRGQTSVDISGWWVTDTHNTPMRWSFPGGTVLPPGGHYVVSEVTLGFSFSSLGEEVMLTAPDGITGMDYLPFSDQQPDLSLGRAADGLPLWSIFNTPTPGMPNPDPATPAVDDVAPSVLSINGVYPNPFNPSTTIGFALPQSGEVGVQIFSLDGRLVRTINAGVFDSGPQQILFNGLDDYGHPLASGTWFAKVSCGSASDVVKMMLVK